MKFLNVMSSSCSSPKTGQKGFWMSMAGLWHLSCWTFMYILKSMHLNRKETKEHYQKCHHLTRLLHSQLQVKTFDINIHQQCINQPPPPNHTSQPPSGHLMWLMLVRSNQSLSTKSAASLRWFQCISHNPRETWHKYGRLEFSKGVSSLGSNFWF